MDIFKYKRTTPKENTPQRPKLTRSQSDRGSHMRIAKGDTSNLQSHKSLKKEEESFASITPREEKTSLKSRRASLVKLPSLKNLKSLTKNKDLSDSEKSSDDSSFDNTSFSSEDSPVSIETSSRDQSSNSSSRSPSPLKRTKSSFFGTSKTSKHKTEKKADESLAKSKPKSPKIKKTTSKKALEKKTSDVLSQASKIYTEALEPKLSDLKTSIIDKARITLAYQSLIEAENTFSNPNIDIHMASEKTQAALTIINTTFFELENYTQAKETYLASPRNNDLKEIFLNNLLNITNILSDKVKDTQAYRILHEEIVPLLMQTETHSIVWENNITQLEEICYELIQLETDDSNQSSLAQKAADALNEIHTEQLEMVNLHRLLDAKAAYLEAKSNNSSDLNTKENKYIQTLLHYHRIDPKTMPELMNNIIRAKGPSEVAGKGEVGESVIKIEKDGVKKFIKKETKLRDLKTGQILGSAAPKIKAIGLNPDAPKGIEHDIIAYEVAEKIAETSGNDAWRIVVKTEPGILIDDDGIHLVHIMDEAKGVSAAGDTVRTKAAPSASFYRSRIDQLRNFALREPGSDKNNPNLILEYIQKNGVNMVFDPKDPVNSTLEIGPEIEEIEFNGVRYNVPVISYETAVFDTDKTQLDIETLKPLFIRKNLIDFVIKNIDGHMSNLHTTGKTASAFDFGLSGGSTTVDMNNLAKKMISNTGEFPVVIPTDICEEFLTFTVEDVLAIAGRRLGENHQEEINTYEAQLKSIQEHVKKVLADDGHLKNAKGQPIRETISNSYWLHFQRYIEVANVKQRELVLPSSR